VNATAFAPLLKLSGHFPFQMKRLIISRAVANGDGRSPFVFLALSSQDIVSKYDAISNSIIKYNNYLHIR
jgi:hypothetical protein